VQNDDAILHTDREHGSERRNDPKRGGSRKDNNMNADSSGNGELANCCVRTVLLAGLLATGASRGAAESDLILPETPWRVWMVTSAPIARDKSGELVVRRQHKESPFSLDSAGLSSLPPANWRAKEYDDAVWGRYGEELTQWAGLYGRSFGYGGSEHPMLLCLRTRFGVADPARAAGLKLTLEYIGGVVVYVNGTEVGRGHMPAGPLESYTPAADYPLEAYVAEDRTTPLPSLRNGEKPDAKLLPRYQKRVRTLSLDLPAGCLTKGANVLALELHRSLACGPGLRDVQWWHLGLGAVKLTAPGTEGVIPYAEACKGPRVWSAQAVEQVTAKPAARFRLDRGGESIVVRGDMNVGLSAGNPFDPVVPVRIVAPRNGVGNGQIVLSDPAGLRGVSASLSPLRGSGDAALPPSAVRVRFAVQGDLHWCDELMDQPPDVVSTLPVWLEVQVPRTQAPGWYAATLTLAANGKQFQTPVQVLVTAYTAPDPRDFRSVMVVMHSPEALAKSYNAKPWSDAHFELMGQSLEFAGQLGGDVVFVPVMAGTYMGHETGLIRWVKSGNGSKPDYTLFEKYLDFHVKHCGPPKAINLLVWSEDTVKEVADAYENRQIPTREYKPRRPLQVTQWDPATGVATNVPAPTFLDPGAEAFWKPLFDGVRELVKRRGWPEQVIILGIGGDIRPSKRTGELVRQWAPYARWNLYSHFSADPGALFYRGSPPPGWAPGKFIAIGDLEVGLKEAPCGGICSAAQLEKLWQEKNEYLSANIHRLGAGTRAGPLVYRTQPLGDGRWARLGIDFWPKVARYHGLIWGATPNWLTARGPKGPVATVRLQMVREGLQDFEARMAILEASAKLPAEQQKPYRELLDDFPRRVKAGGGFLWGDECLPQTELSYDWYAYVARLHRTAAELAGVRSAAKWEEPPK
jgi:hypothetical protein